MLIRPALRTLSRLLHVKKVPKSLSIAQYGEDSWKQEESGHQRPNVVPLLLFSAPALLASKATAEEDSNPSTELSELILYEEENVDIIKIRKLLKAGADPNFRYEGGWTLMHVAVAKGNIQLAKLLLRFGCDPNCVDQYPRVAVPHYKLEKVRHTRLCLNSNFKENVDWSGFTPLHYAVLNDDSKMCKVLLEHGASVVAQTNTGFRPIDLAADNEIKILLKEKEEEEKKQKILSLGPWLKSTVIGQERALAEVTAAVQRRDLGWQDGKPLVMLFVGSSGIGKTETAKQLAAHKNSGNPDSKVSFIRIDMSEFQERHEVSKFIGSPPGYIGHEEGGQLTKALTAHPDSVVLFDEVEKAHPDVLNIMLQLFDEGRLTDGKGKTIVCPNAIFIMTTNVGADQIASTTTHQIDDDFKKAVMYPLLKRAFKRNEFLGRINEIVYFLPFTESQCVELVEKELLRVQEHAQKLDISFNWTRDAAVDLSRAIDKNYGARSLKNEVARQIVNKMADLNLEGKIKAGSSVQLDLVNGDIEFTVN